MSVVPLLWLVFLQADAADLYQRGVADYNAGRYEDAVALLEQAAAIRSDVPDYRFHLGLAYLKTGDPRKAARELEAALGMVGLRRETRLKEPLILVQAAIAYLHLGDVRTARMRAELALKRSEPSADIEYILGLVEREEGDESAALSHFASAVELDRDHREANLALATALSREGRTDEAREALKHATHREEATYEVYMALGELAYAAGDVEEAGDAFALARESRPDDPRARYNLGTVRLAQGRYAEAIELLSTLEDVGALFNLAEAHRATGASVEARDVLARVLAREPDRVEARFAMALVLESLGDLEGAESAYRSLLESVPTHLGGLLNLSALLERTDRADAAVPLLQKALDAGVGPEQRESIESALALLKERDAGGR